MQNRNSSLLVSLNTRIAVTLANIQVKNKNRTYLWRSQVPSCWRKAEFKK